MGLEHLWVLVSMWGPATGPLQVARDDCNYVSVSRLVLLKDRWGRE